MKRQKPTKQLMMELCAGGNERNASFLESLHHGLFELQLSAFYQHLDFDELVAFAASSWKTKNRSGGTNSDLSDVAQNGSVYEIFNSVYKIGFPWLNKEKNIITPALITKHDGMNPFKGKGLEERLDRVSDESVTQLRKDLQEGVHDYVFDCQYSQRKAMRGGDNYKLEPMPFQNAYPKRGKIAPAYASETARQIKAMSANYIPL